MSLPVDTRGETLFLRGDGAAYWPARSTLLVADLHFGKAEALRAAGVPAPGGTERTLSKLELALAQTGAKRLIVLGDFWHVREGRTKRVLDELASWRRDHSELEIELIRGNHDRAGNPPRGWGESWPTVALVEPPFCFRHDPIPCVDGYVIAGHLHPGIDLAGRGRERFRLACFWFGDHCAVLPAFGDWTGLASISPELGDRVYALAEGQVLPIPVGSSPRASQ